MGLLLCYFSLLLVGALVRVRGFAISANPSDKGISHELRESLFLKSLYEQDSDHKSEQNKVKVPQYMLDLFASVTDNKTGRRRKNVTLPGRIVRSFYSQALPGNRDLPAHLVFNITDIPKTEVIRKCELRIYRKKSRHSSARKTKQSHVCRIQIRSSGIGKSIDAKSLNSIRFGWVKFDVTSAVKYAMRPKFQIRDILLKLSVVGTQRKGKEDKPEFAFNKLDTEEPILVVYTDDNRAPKTFATNSKASGVSLEEYISKLKTIRARKRIKRHIKKSEKKLDCHREDMIVDFNRIGWSKIILHPTKFNAYRCSGSCHGSKSQFNKIKRTFESNCKNTKVKNFQSGRATTLQMKEMRTNHELIQKTISEMEGNFPASSASCCQPKELESLTFLVVEQHSPQVIVNIKSFDDVVVKSCSCL